MKTSWKQIGIGIAHQSLKTKRMIGSFDLHAVYYCGGYARVVENGSVSARSQGKACNEGDVIKMIVSFPTR